MTRNQILKRFADLEFRINIKVAERHRRMRETEPYRQTITLEHIHALTAFTTGLRLMGISDDSGLKLGLSNRLPQTLQGHYNWVFDPQDKDCDQTTSEDDISLLEPTRPSLEERHPRWRLHAWICKCGAHDTLWHKTHLRYKDRYQIYCASCKSLAGWGTKPEFEDVTRSGEGQLLTLSHPLDRELFDPEPLPSAKDQHPQSGIRAKQSQSSLRSKVRCR